VRAQLTCSLNTTRLAGSAQRATTQAQHTARQEEKSVHDRSGARKARLVCCVLRRIAMLHCQLPPDRLHPAIASTSAARWCRQRRRRRRRGRGDARGRGRWTATTAAAAPIPLPIPCPHLPAPSRFRTQFPWCCRCARCERGGALGPGQRRARPRAAKADQRSRAAIGTRREKEGEELRS
jgi:hypothetical protein